MTDNTTTEINQITQKLLTTDNEQEKQQLLQEIVNNIQPGYTIDDLLKTELFKDGSYCTKLCISSASLKEKQELREKLITQIVISKPTFFSSYDDFQSIIDILDINISNIMSNDLKTIESLSLITKDIEMIYTLYDHFKQGDNQYDKDRIASLNNCFDHNETLKIELLQKAISENLINDHTIQYLELKNIKNPELYLKVIRDIETKIHTSPEQIFKLMQGKNIIKQMYEPILSTSYQDLSKCFTIAGFNKIKNLGNIENLTFADICCYYLRKNNNEFSEMLSANIKDDIHNSFKLSNKDFLYSNNDLLDIKILCNQYLTSQYLSTKQICNYFKKKINIPQLPENFDNVKLNFSGSNHNLAQQQKLNILFKELLKSKVKFEDCYYSNDSSDDFITNISLFFEQALHIDMKDISISNKAKLAQFFISNKKNLFYLLTSEEFGLTEFKKDLTTALSDGCSANISSQFNMSFNRLLLKSNNIDIALYDILYNNIVPTIVNNKGHSDALFMTPDLLNNFNINNYFISGNSLIKKISNECVKQPGKLPELLLECLKKELQDEGLALWIRSKIYEDNNYNNESVANITAYLIIKHTIDPKEQIIKESKISEEIINTKTNILEEFNEFKNDIFTICEAIMQSKRSKLSNIKDELNIQIGDNLQNRKENCNTKELIQILNTIRKGILPTNSDTNITIEEEKFYYDNQLGKEIEDFVYSESPKTPQISRQQSPIKEGLHSIINHEDIKILIQESSLGNRYVIPSWQTRVTSPDNNEIIKHSPTKTNEDNTNISSPQINRETNTLRHAKSSPNLFDNDNKQTHFTERHSTNRNRRRIEDFRGDDGRIDFDKIYRSLNLEYQDPDLVRHSSFRNF